MEGTAATSFFSTFTSPWRNLAWSFRKSRDSWKRKYQELKRDQKRLENQVRDVRKSREHWREQAEEKEKELQAVHEEMARVRVELATTEAASEKKG